MAKVENSLRNQSILVIDDNELTRRTLKVKFEEMGAIVFTSGHIEKSITVLDGLVSNKQLPSLVIIDVQLPDCFGFRALYKLQKSLRGNYVPLIVASRGFDDFAVTGMLLFGVVGYVEKPVLIEKLFKFALEALQFQNKKQVSSPASIENAS